MNIPKRITPSEPGEMVKEKTKAYTAGFVDAEGCMYIGRREKPNGVINYRYGLIVTNTCLRIMKWLVKHWGGSFKCREISTGCRYDWSTAGSGHTLRVLDAIEPYLIIKSEQATLLRDYLLPGGRDDPKAREKLWARCRFLKRQPLGRVTTNTPSPAQKKHFGAYAAGVLDGDGSIIISKGKSSGTIWASAGISNGDPRVVRLFRARFGGTIYTRRFTNPQWRENYSWLVTRADEKSKFLLATIPYLIVKREKAKIALELTRLDSKEHRRDAVNSVYHLRERLFERSKIESDLTRNRKSAPPVMAVA